MAENSTNHALQTSRSSSPLNMPNSDKNFKSVDIVIPVYQGKHIIGKTLDSIASQQYPDSLRVKVIVVDDGSTDHCTEYLGNEYGGLVDHMVSLKHNRGRAFARNIGCAEGNGNIIILLDADCVPLKNNFIVNHCRALEEYSLSCGALVPSNSGNDFWSRYQEEVFQRRKDAFNQYHQLNFTTANIALTRRMFIAAGGFNEEYQYYGFEDLDFRMRCEAAAAKLTFTPTAAVSHEAELRLNDIGEKMLESGRYSAKIFQQQHPEYYQRTPYGRIDVNLHPQLKPIALFIFPVVTRLTPLLNKLLTSSFLPYSIKRLIVKTSSALHFMRGTSLMKTN